jgi:hypothetical protein
MQRQGSFARTKYAGKKKQTRRAKPPPTHNCSGFPKIEPGSNANCFTAF